MATVREDGNFCVMKRETQECKWASETYDIGVAPYEVKIGEDGNLVVLDSQNL
jgi:hypothetical protein